MDEHAALQRIRPIAGQLFQQLLCHMPKRAFSSATPAVTNADDLKINKNYMGLVKFTDAETEGHAWRFGA
jgi:hypothetical protein